MAHCNVIQNLLNQIHHLPAFKKIADDVRTNNKRKGLALSRSARLPILSLLQDEIHRPILLITDRADRALHLLDEASFWCSDIRLMIFPEPNPLFYEQGEWGSKTRRDRLQVLATLAEYHIPGHVHNLQPPIIIAPIRAVMTKTLPLRDYLKTSKKLQINKQIQPEFLLHQWLEIGYQAVDTVLEPGFFSHRGGIVDIWVPPEPYPIRLEFFGDEIETIRGFNPSTQRTIINLEYLNITPAREALPGKASSLNLPNEKISEYYLPQIHSISNTLVDYLPRDTIILIDDLESLDAMTTEIEEQSTKLRQDSISEGILSPDFPVPYLTWSEILDQLEEYYWLELGRATSDEPSELAQLFNFGPRFGGYLNNFIDCLAQICKNQNDQVLIISRQGLRLKDLWNERQNAQQCLNNPVFIEETLSEGWVLSLPGDNKLYLFTDSEIFGWEKPKPRRQQRPIAKAPEAEFADLKPGSWIVHVDHGIGRYVGLVQRVLEGIEREYLCVEYDGGDQLFVPVHQADRLSRYIGPNNSTPTPTRLGSSEWLLTKQKVNESVQEVAKDLLEIYAKRQVANGFAFSPDVLWQQELEASFPYVETPDQSLAIKEVKKDMESPRPMDRLLCGDVGYGKTEVALRAAFKAVMDGKQVAMLVPTTVLAQQHYETFRQRLAAFPVEVEMLSRFRSTKEQNEIIKKLANGAIDIIIGTHRLLQSDVQFKELCLLIIDEEQRFGVTHKEYFKKLRTEIDVLTLTATPIPRTLYMALTNARDISTINTPPDERLPITTHIGPYSPALVRQAILRELERGGQIFFVHNRVQTIPAMYRHINKIVPEATIGIAHGQMPEDDLATVMHQFTKGEIDVLLCTSIIESGLDIPNANTLIVDRGDTFGLAQLYQLRGRVGRGTVRAYAYFFRHRHRTATIEGQERLEVIAENIQLGAGYSIAMRDLEMRGAGEILGTRQHGYIASVGFHLYTRLLTQAVRELRQEQGLNIINENGKFGLSDLRLPVNVDLPLAIGIPLQYIPDQVIRLQLYRRLASLSSDKEIQTISEEYVDRFGPPPEAFLDLLFQMRVKVQAEKAGLVFVGVEAGQLVLRFPTLPNGMSQRDLPEVGLGTRVGKNAYWMLFDPDSDEWKGNLLNVLAAIISNCKTTQF